MNFFFLVKNKTKKLGWIIAEVNLWPATFFLYYLLGAGRMLSKQHKTEIYWRGISSRSLCALFVQYQLYIGICK